ncbi:MAG TPA: metalloregulator ArsR/SmtB family transcription factor [Pyrinomonadaceae bacterium]|nr:metalloregulator ArsR/SmtB family transcription factor [Pyrinomonadaceae bacterium]
MSEEKAFNKELFFAALADRTRLRLLNLMQDGELCVCYFPEIIGTNQPKISRHLAYLRRAGLVSVRREWKWAHYRITEPKSGQAAKVFREILEWIKDDQEMQLDRMKLLNLCCAPVQKQPISIQGAPRPLKLENQTT